MRSHLIAAGAVVAGVALAAVVAGRSADAAAPKKDIDPTAARMVREMADYVSGLQSFTVRTAVTDEVALKSGQKIEIMSNAEVAVQRPNRLRSTRRGTQAGLDVWYDGEHLTISCKGSNAYQTVAAAPNLDGVIDQLRDKLDMDAPGADLLYSKPYDALMEQVTSGRFIGVETIDGVLANHVAFRGDTVDWQLWIKDGPVPLPLRYVITTKDVRGHPEFAVQMSDWNTEPKFSASTFKFEAPEDFKAAKAVAPQCGTQL
jgi:hypothetical protein